MAKADTFGLDEITFLKVECERTGSKASYLINKWIREKMRGQIEEIRKVKGPESYCNHCQAYKEYIRDGQLNMSWLCEGCGENKTELINGMIERNKY